MDLFATSEVDQTQGWLGVIISSTACILGASVVFLDKFFRVSILDSRAFMACSMALASGVLLFSSLSILFPQAQQKLGSNNDVSLYGYFFGGAIFTLVLTKLIHYMMPDAIHACGDSAESCHHTPSDEESNHHHHHAHNNHHHDHSNHNSHHHNHHAHSQHKKQRKHHSDERQKLNDHPCDVEYGTIRSSESHFRFHHDDLVHSNSSPKLGQKKSSNSHLSHLSHLSSSSNDICENGNRNDSEGSSTVSESASTQHHKHHETVEETVEKDPAHYYSIGIQTAFAICVHKFPEGLIMFVSSQASAKVGLSVSIAMSIHNLTEGFMIALPLYYATRSRTTAFVAAAVMGGFSQPLGALLGLFLVKNISKESENLLFGIVFACVSGMMSLITIQSMLPQAIRADTHQRYVLPFFFIGILLVGLSSILKNLN